MKEETFEQRRIVQLSKELDAERDKYSKLAKDSGFLNAKLKETQEEIQQNKEKLIEYQINNHRLTQNLREVERENQKLRQNIEKEQNLRSQAEVQNVRQRQKIDEYKTQLQEYENKTKAILFERSNQIAAKDKQLYRLKQQNIEVEKIYLAEKEKLQKKEQKHLRELTSLFQSFQALKKELNQVKEEKQRQLQKIRGQNEREMSEVMNRMDDINRKVRIQQDLQAEIDLMKVHLQDVVMENSQKIIELYKYKYAK